MARLLVASLLGALAALAAARFLPAPHWVDALFLTGALAGLALALALALLLRLRWSHRWHGVAALALALASNTGRGAVLAQRWLSPASGAPALQMDQVLLAWATLVWAGLALVWGALGLADALDDLSGATPGRWPAVARLAAGGAAVTLALHGLAPLGRLLELELNIWSLLVLAGLALAGYGVGWIHRRICWRSRRGG